MTSSRTQCRQLPRFRVAAAASAIYVLGLLLVVAAIPTALGSYTSMLDVMTAANNLTVFKRLVEASGLNDTLGNTSFVGTGFFPTDDALQRFAKEQGLESTDDLLAKVNKIHLANFVKYHIIFNQSLNQIGLTTSKRNHLTLLSADYVASFPWIFTWLGNMTCTTAEDPDCTIKGTDGIDANITMFDISVNDNTSYVHIIDAALQYWYTNMSTAAATHNFTSYYKALVNAKSANLLPGNVTLQYFAPWDNAVARFVQTLYPFSDVNITSSDVMAPAAIDVIAHHVSAEVIPDIPSFPDQQTLQTLSSQRPGNNIKFSVTYPGTATINGVQYKYPVPRISSLGSPSTGASGFYGRIPVGGIVPSCYVMVIREVLLPVYGTVWDYLENAAANEPQGPSYNLFTTFIDSSSNSIKNNLQAASSTITLLAPSDRGVSSFLSRYGQKGGLKETFNQGSHALMIQQVHVINGQALNTSQFNNGMRLKTLQGDSLISFTTGGSQTITIISNQTNATMGSQVVDVSILYGRSYVQAIDFVLVPSGVQLLQSGAAGSHSAFSLMNLVFSVLLGRLAVKYAMG